MKNLDFKYIAAWNFLPFGPEGIEVHLENYKNIVLIRGENRDAKSIDPVLYNDNEEFKISSNGTGKSSLQEIIVYGLFGKTVKQKVGVNEVVHNLVGKDCKIELIFGDYRVVRTRMEGGRKEKSTLRLWESVEGVWDKNTEITQGTSQTTQKKIETIIGLSYDAFVNMCIFTDDQRLCFLECDNQQKKEIVENLLSLGNYREWHENAKVLRKEIKVGIDTKTKEFQILINSTDDAKRRLALTQKKNEDWKNSKENEILILEKNIISKSHELKNTDTGKAILAYQEAQEKIQEINVKLLDLESSKESLSKNLEIVNEKDANFKFEAQNLKKEYDDLSQNAKIKMNERKKKEEEIVDLESNNPGTPCNKCRGIIEKENIASYVSGLNIEISNINIDIKSFVESAKEIGKKSEELKEKQKKVLAYQNQFLTKINKSDTEMRQLRSELTQASQVREPKADSIEFLLQQQIEDIKKQIEVKKVELSGRSPFQDIIDNDVIELENSINTAESKEKEVKELEAELPYYDYWISGFGENGIRKWVIDGIIPELNNRINYWLQFLIDNKITLTFDNQLNEKIERNPVDGNPYIYHAMSTGQRRRLNLAVSQSFAHIMMISSGSVPSIVFLDEISTNIDPLGVQGIYNMICELSEDKKVFVTTHDPDLLRMLQGSDVIKLTHEKGFTKLET
jgi:DNA repair exonuclease SbcCD ATPase subunit